MKPYRKDCEYSYSLGMTLTFNLIEDKPDAVTNVYISPSLKSGEAADKLYQLCESYRIPITVNDKAFKILSPKENCYVIGEFRKYTSYLKYDENHIVLVNPSNSGNLGTIIRSAIGFGVRNIAVICPAVDFFDPKVIRASMGSFWKVDIAYYESWESYISEFSDNHIYPFMLDAKVCLHDTALKEPFSLVFGNESSGLSESFHSKGQSLAISQSDSIDSLSLPMAVSIALYEISLRRGIYRQG